LVESENVGHMDIFQEHQTWALDQPWIGGVRADAGLQAGKWSVLGIQITDSGTSPSNTLFYDMRASYTQTMATAITIGPWLAAGSYQTELAETVIGNAYEEDRWTTPTDTAPSGAEPFVGRIAEVLVYQAELSEAQRGQLKNYIDRKYRLQ
jgi:hypothetical protein